MQQSHSGTAYLRLTLYMILLGILPHWPQTAGSTIFLLGFHFLNESFESLFKRKKKIQSLPRKDVGDYDILHQLNIT